MVSSISFASRSISCNRAFNLPSVSKVVYLPRRMHLDYIKQHRRGRYTTLLTEGKLNARLHEIDVQANEMLETIIPRLATERGIDENLKARDMLRWVAEMNNIKASAEEIVLRKVIYV